MSKRTWGARLVALTLAFTITACNTKMETNAQTREPADTSVAEQAADEGVAKGPFYYVELSSGGAAVNVILNDLSMYQTRYGSFLANPVNVRLVSEGNELKIVAGPTMNMDSTALTTPSDAHLTGAVKLYEAGDLFGTQDGETLLTFDLQEEIERRRDSLKRSFQERLKSAKPSERKELLDRQEKLTRVAFPVEMTVTFDSPKTPSFRERLLEAPAITDTSRLLDYAIRLRQLMREEDTRGLFEAFEIKNEDYNRAYYENDAYEWWKDVFEDMYPSELKTDFEREDVGLRSKLGGRVWELYVKNGEPDQPWHPTGRPFFETKGKDGYLQTISVHIAEVDGELKVIR